MTSHLNNSLEPNVDQQPLPNEILPFVSPPPPSTQDPAGRRSILISAVAPPTATYSSYHQRGSCPASSTEAVPDFTNGLATSPSMSASQEIPYTSIDGRRKRRRTSTTFEDAFQHCLTVTVNDDDVPINNEITTPIKDCNYDAMFMDDDDENEIGNNGPFNYSSPSTNGYNPGCPLDKSRDYEISKRLAFSDHDATAASRDPAIFRTSSTDNMCVLDSNHDEDDTAISFTSDLEYSSSSADLASVEPSTPMVFAPRKGKKKIHNLDPVDERIEELIRHSRIKAMVLNNRGTERQTQRQNIHAQFKAQQMDEKEMDHGGEKKEIPSELRRKNEKEQSMFTGKSTDDIALPWARGRSLSRGRSLTSSGNLLDKDGRHQSRSNSL
jgi:hypothetical protein